MTIIKPISTGRYYHCMYILIIGIEMSSGSIHLTAKEITGGD
jgi:hypothetical protein